MRGSIIRCDSGRCTNVDQDVEDVCKRWSLAAETKHKPLIHTFTSEGSKVRIDLHKIEAVTVWPDKQPDEIR